MAFGIDRSELRQWKNKAKAGEISIITHYWLDERFPSCDTVTKVACSDYKKLLQWGERYGFHPEWIHARGSLSHFDLFGDQQVIVLKKEGMVDQYERFIRK